MIEAYNRSGFTKEDVESLIFYFEDFVPDAERVTLNRNKIELLIDALEYYKEQLYT